MNFALAVRGVISLGECFVMATAILLLAWLMTMFLRRNSAMRHLIWVIAFCSLLITPALVAFVPAHFVLHVPRAVAKSSAVDLRPNGAPTAETAAGDRKRSTETLKSRYAMPIAAVLLGVWFAGIGIVAIMGSVGAYRVCRFRRSSLEHRFDSLDLPELSARIGLQRRWKLRVSLAQNPPAAMTWGVLHPVILLPKESVAWTGERLQAVLLHELAHVRRYDSLSQWLAFAACALYWFHPAVWRFVGVMRAEAELAADDAVLVSGMKPSAYAAVLLRFAAELRQVGAPMVYAGVSFMRQSRIAIRIESILNIDQRDRRVTLLQAGKAIGISLAAVLLLTALRPSVSLANTSSLPAGDLSARSIQQESIKSESLSPRDQKTAQSSRVPTVPGKTSTKRCHRKDAALKSLKTHSAG
jgi:beta-lactamase regulating signal transducer with metallopeptidase domain